MASEATLDDTRRRPASGRLCAYQYDGPIHLMGFISGCWTLLEMLRAISRLLALARCFLQNREFLLHRILRLTVLDVGRAGADGCLLLSLPAGPQKHQDQKC